MAGTVSAWQTANAASPGAAPGALVRRFADWRLTAAYTERTVHAVYWPTRRLPQKVRALIDQLFEMNA